MPQQDDLKIRSASAAWWTAANPILASGELGYETPIGPKRAGRLKRGDGVTAWNSLGYFERGNPCVISLGDVVEVDDQVTQIDITVPNTSDYESLVVVLTGRTHAGGAGAYLDIKLRFNDDTANNYDSQNLIGQGTTLVVTPARGQPWMVAGYLGDYNSGTGVACMHGPLVIEVPLHRAAAGFRTILGGSGAMYGTAATALTHTRAFGMWRSLAAVTKISLIPTGSPFESSTQVICFGVRPPA